jgi:hypothetical protein
LFLFFFLCSIYSGILSIKKAPRANQITFNTFLAYLLILVSSVSFIGIIIALLYFTNI